MFADRYRILRPLGRGASKTVYLAHDERLDRDVALALLPGGGASERVRRELRVTGRLGEHPHVVTVHDAGEHEGVAYAVLRVLAGGSLAERAAAASGRRLPVDDVARLGAQIADALAHAHAHGVVHRDVKPANVWLDPQGRAVLGDFGVALEAGASHPGGITGTPAYLSPEQARGEPATPASDLYALGATLYELACGRPPFLGDSREALVAQHLSAVPAPPSRHEPAAAPLDSIVLRLLAKAPAERPPSAAAVREELAAGAPGTLVGRREAMTALSGALDDALAGRPRVLALAGEPGIGKTACAEQLAALAARRGCLVAWGACSEDEGAPAYWPWRRALRESGADLEALFAAGSEADRPEEGRFRLFEAVVDALERAAAERPLALVLEDLHWADRSSLQLLVHVARELRERPVLVLITHRPPRDAADDPLRDVLGRLAGAASFGAVELDGLGDAEVAQLAEAVAGQAVTPAVAATLRERTRGNPLYVGELVRALAAAGRVEEGAGAEVPAGLGAIIAARAAALPEPTRELLALAAVAGTDFRLRVVARAAGLEPAGVLSALEPALRDGLLAPSGGAGHRFAHAVTREVLYEAQPVARRAERHRRLAELLEARLERAPDQPVAEIAHHAVIAARGGLDAAPALRWSREAAREARAVLAHAEAALHLDRAIEALELGELGSAADRLSLLLEAAATDAAAGLLGGAQERYEQAAALARRIGDADAFAQAALGYAEFQHYGVVDERAIALLEEARDRLPPGDGVVLAQVLGRLGVRLDPATEQPRREALLDEAIAMARAVGDRAALTRLLALSPLVNWRPERSARRAADAAEVLDLAASGGDREAALWAHIVLHADRFAEGDVAGADRELAAYERLAGELRMHYYRWYGRVLAATRAIFDGRVAEGRRLAAEAVAENRRHEEDSEQEWVVQELLVARLAHRPRDVPLDGLREFAARYPALPVWRALLALGEWVAGDADAARAACEECAPRGPAALPADADLPCTLALLADVSVSVGELRHAAELRERLEPYAARNVLTDRSWAAWGAAARPLGRLAAALGDAEGAAVHFEHSVLLHRRWGSRPWLAITIGDYASALPGAPPRELLDEGAALARRLGLQTPMTTKPAQW